MKSLLPLRRHPLRLDQPAWLMGWSGWVRGLALVLACAAAVPGRALDLTAVTLFLCDGQGAVNPVGRWNSGPKDAAWDLFFYRGEMRGPGSSGAVPWLNGENNLLRVPLEPGLHRLTFHFESSGALPRLGLNLFFDGRHDRPGISAMADVDTDGAPWPEFKANGASATMGPPIETVPGAGTLRFDGSTVGLWSYGKSEGRLRVTLEDFHVVNPAVAQSPDLVGPHAAGRSGQPDHVGQIVLRVEEHVPRPPELALWLRTAAGVTVGTGEGEPAWADRFEAEEARAPFSFVYDGKSSGDLLAGWGREQQRRKLDERRTAHTLVYREPGTGLVVRWEAVEYRDFPVLEWTLYFKNDGQAPTAVLSNLLALDIDLQRPPAEEFQLHHWKGTFVRKDDYEPLTTVLKPSDSLRFAPPGGRPCGHVFPYFNLQTAREGLMVVVSWAGQWMAQFTRDNGRGLRIVAGQETTRFKLNPGEEVRTPMVVLLFWKEGDWIDAQNLWRRWMIRHNLPRPGGKLPPLPQFAACSSHQFAEMIHADEASQKLFVDRYLQEELKLDYWWMDAGWYVNETGWPQTGTWEVDRKRFPNGLRAISDYARAKGVKTIVWFEPERVAANTWLTKTHPEWVIGGAGGGLLNLGNPEAWAWLVEHFSGLIRAEGVDLYRQDYNIDPLGHWRSLDGPDRQGITENHHVTGYLAYWDELRRRYPNMLIDTCASGGHRNDLETLRRSVPLLRSDYIFEPVGQQGHTYGLSFWIPFHGTAMSYPDRYDPYVYRSNMTPHNTGCFDVRRRDLDYALLRRLVGQWRKIAPYYFGDYYPLTPYSVEEDAWIAWQFHRPEAGDGFVQAFRRSRSSFFGVQLPLRGLDPNTRYEVSNVDLRESTVSSGRELTTQGLRIAVEERPGAALITYRRAP